MAIRMPRFIHSKRILRQFSTTTDHGDSMASSVPKGYLAAYVGEQEKTRFVVPVSILNLPSFQDLLSRAEKEYGFDHPMGGLTVPCSEELFLDVIHQLKGL